MSLLSIRANLYASIYLQTSPPMVEIMSDTAPGAQIPDPPGFKWPDSMGLGRRYPSFHVLEPSAVSVTRFPKWLSKI